jgi:plastocyanin
MSGRLRAVTIGLAVPVIAAIVAVVTLTSTSAPGSGAAASAGSNGTKIVISNFTFSPSILHVAPGTTITITNNDGVTHTVTGDDKSFDSGQIAGGATAMVTLRSPGKYTYHCDIHNYMTGTIEVK